MEAVSCTMLYECVNFMRKNYLKNPFGVQDEPSTFFG